jgi:hypothetical protein
VLFERAPQLAPARAQIETFFKRSSLMFFGNATTNSSSMGSASTASLPRTLCAELLRIERRHER